MKKCIILANGSPPKKNVLTFLKRLNYSTLICADGGANSAFKMNITPDFIIGDLESVTDKTIKRFGTTSKIIKIKRQNDTDVEKCLKYAIKNNFSAAILTGATGNRLDHTICNLGIILKFYHLIKIRLIAEDSLLVPYSGKVKINTVPGETISIYGFNRKTKITSSGLKYPLNNSILPFGESESTSNKAMTNNVQLDINGGIVFLIRDFNTARQHGFI